MENLKEQVISGTMERLEQEFKKRPELEKLLKTPAKGLDKAY